MTGSGDDFSGLADGVADVAEEALGEDVVETLDGSANEAEPPDAAAADADAVAADADAVAADADAIAADTDARSSGAEAAEPSEDRSAAKPLSSVDDGLDADWSVRRIVWTMVPLLAGLSVLQMGSGVVLESFEETLLENPALLVLVPVQIGTAGNLASIMCSRLTTQLYLGTYEPSLSNPGVRANVGAVFGLAATVFGAVGVAAWAIGTALGGTLGLAQVLFISLVSGMLLAVLVVVVSIVSVEASYRVGLNPDDTTIPVVTNVCDITGVLILFAVVAVTL